MAITKIAPTKNLYGLIYYISKAEPHTKGEERVLDFSTNLCTLENSYQAFKDTEKYLGREKKIKAYTIIKSWSTDELDPQNEENQRLALESMERLLKELYGDTRQYVIVLQKDGTGGKLHAHAVVNNTDSFTGKAVRGNSKKWEYIARKSDEIDKSLGIKNLNLENDLKPKDKKTLKEIKMIEKNEVLKSQGLDEIYLWKQDLKNIIKDNMKKSTNMKDFKKGLERDGVILTLRGSKAKDSRKGYKASYSFTDKEGKQRKARESTLGTNYSYKTIDETIEEHYKAFIKAFTNQQAKKPSKTHLKDNREEKTISTPNYKPKDKKPLKVKNKRVLDTKEPINKEMEELNKKILENEAVKRQKEKEKKQKEESAKIAERKRKMLYLNYGDYEEKDNGKNIDYDF